jgi:serine/threonine protein kinase
MTDASQPAGAGGPLALRAGGKVGLGRFTLIKPLGRGGMGEVWLAQDERLGEPVALKFLPPEIRGDARALDDLRRETARSHKLTHPNIVRIHDLNEVEGEPAFIAMEYIDGPTLSGLQLQQADRVLSWEFLKPLVQQLCAALDYAHGENVIHRDLKPANIMVDAKGRLKLADFGIAATISDSVSRVSQHNSTSGTLLYMSPQQLAGKRPQAADDIYALGATLYELLTSQPPFYTGDITHQVLHEAAEPPDERLAALGIANAVPPDVAAMVMACLAKDPAQRPQSARAVAEWIGFETSWRSSLDSPDETVVAESQPAILASPNDVANQDQENSTLVEGPAPEPAVEEILWWGKPVFWSFLPGIIWSGAWCILWLRMCASIDKLFLLLVRGPSALNQAQAEWSKEQQDMMSALTSFAPKARWVFYGLSLIALWGVLQKVLQALNTEFQITSTRIKSRTGSFPQKLLQIDLQDVKGIEARQTLLGRLLNYADILLTVENRPATDTLLIAVPEAEAQMELIRIASRRATTTVNGQSGTASPK